MAEESEEVIAEPENQEVVEPEAAESTELYAGKYKDVASLEDGYKELTAKLGERPEADREKIIEEYAEGLRKEVPAEASKYVFEIPEGMLSDDQQVTFDDSDPVMQKWKEFAHKKGLTPEEFNEATALYVENELLSRPNMAKEMESLGENAQARVDRVDMWSAKHLSPEGYGAVVQASTTAGFVGVMEELMKMTSDGVSLESSDTTSSGPLTKDELRTMQLDPRYRSPRDRDEAFVKRVNDGYKALSASRQCSPCKLVSSLF